MKTSFLIVVTCVALIDAGKRKPQGKLTYELNWVNGFGDCEGFSNDVINFGELTMDRDTPSSTALSGQIELKKEIPEAAIITISVEKETAQGKVLAYTMDLEDACDHIGEDGMPWTVFVEQMELESKTCPVPAKVYPMEGLKLSLDFANDLMNHETVGEYVAKLEFKTKGDGPDAVGKDISCHTIGFSVDEKREEKSDE